MKRDGPLYSVAAPGLMSLLRSAVNFEEKWKDVKETIGRVMQLQRVNMTKWNDDYSYPCGLHFWGGCVRKGGACGLRCKRA